MTKRFVLIEVCDEDIGIPEVYQNLKNAQDAMICRMEAVGVDLGDADSYFLSKDRTEACYLGCDEDFSWKIFERNENSYDLV